MSFLEVKNSVTASEIRVLARKSSEEFNFYPLAPNKIYQLIKDEKIQVQV